MSESGRHFFRGALCAVSVPILSLALGAGMLLGQTEPGLGPRFNLDSCGGCHSQPAIGGTSPAVNPQVAVANKNGASNCFQRPHGKSEAGHPKFPAFALTARNYW